MKWILIFHLLSPPVTMPVPYESQQACRDAGEITSPSCATIKFGWCSGRKFLCVPQPKDAS